jgi:hypothetical protein
MGGGIIFFFDSRRRIAVERFHQGGIKKNWIPMIMEIPELPVFGPKKGI